MPLSSQASALIVIDTAATARMLSVGEDLTESVLRYGGQPKLLERLFDRRPPGLGDGARVR